MTTLPPWNASFLDALLVFPTSCVPSQVPLLTPVHPRPLFPPSLCSSCAPDVPTRHLLSFCMWASHKNRTLVLPIETCFSSSLTHICQWLHCLPISLSQIPESWFLFSPSSHAVHWEVFCSLFSKWVLYLPTDFPHTVLIQLLQWHLIRVPPDPFAVSFLHSSH